MSLQHGRPSPSVCEVLSTRLQFLTYGWDWETTDWHTCYFYALLSYCFISRQWHGASRFWGPQNSWAEEFFFINILAMFWRKTAHYVVQIAHFPILGMNGKPVGLREPARAGNGSWVSVRWTWPWPVYVFSHTQSNSPLAIRNQRTHRFIETTEACVTLWHFCLITLIALQCFMSSCRQQMLLSIWTFAEYNVICVTVWAIAIVLCVIFIASSHGSSWVMGHHHC